LGFERLPFPLAEDTTLFSDLEGTLKWLNTAPSEADRSSVKFALRKPEFKLAKDRNSKSPSHLEIDWY
jgi:hypothetical protein